MTALAPNATPVPIPSGYRKTEANAIERRERAKASDDVRVARAALLAKGEAQAEANRQNETKVMRRPFELIREILIGATDAQVAELATHAGRLDPAGLAQIASDMAVERSRSRSNVATQSPVQGDEAVELPTEPRRRRSA